MIATWPSEVLAQSSGRNDRERETFQGVPRFFDPSAWIRRRTASNDIIQTSFLLFDRPQDPVDSTPIDSGENPDASLSPNQSPLRSPEVGPPAPGSSDSSNDAQNSPDDVNTSSDDAKDSLNDVKASTDDASTDDASASSDTPSTPAEATSTGTSNTADLQVPSAERALGAGEPTTATAAVEAAEDSADPHAPTLLQDYLGYGESPVKIHGWLQNSFTYNANGRGKSGLNFGVNPNDLANRWMGNQYYIIVENPLEQNDSINFGFRVDSLFGNDWQFNYMQGLFNGAFPVNSFAGYDMSQLYGEVHLPFLTEHGIDVKGGRFFTLAGYEQVPAIARPLLSVPYMFEYGQPFTHLGVMTTLHLTDRVNLYNGAINGWDRWVNQRYVWGYLGGFSWSSRDHRTTIAMTAIWGPNQFPSVLGKQQLYPDGYVNIPSLAGLPNPGYWRNDRTFFTWVGTHRWSDRLTQVVETDQGWERAIPGLASGGRNGSPRDATWFSFGNWFLYEFSPKLTGVWRSEIFWDPQGARVQNMIDGAFVGDRYHEITVGAIYKPHPNLWIRPEARYDWSQFHPAYTDDTRKNQFTLGFDVIVLW